MSQESVQCQNGAHQMDTSSKQKKKKKRKKKSKEPKENKEIEQDLAKSDCVDSNDSDDEVD